MKKLLVVIALLSIAAALFAGTIPVFAQEEPHFPVTIDVKPGGFPNPINLKSNGVIPVALFGAADFNVRDVIIGTVGLHPHDRPAGAIPPVRYAFEDVNKDGFMDIIFQFSTQALAPLLQPGDTILCLHGNNPNVTPNHFCGMDTVVIKLK